jgi:hypothetical protein
MGSRLVKTKWQVASANYQRESVANSHFTQTTFSSLSSAAHGQIQHLDMHPLIFLVVNSPYYLQVI